MKHESAITIVDGTLHVVFVTCKRFFSEVGEGGIESMGKRVLKGLDASRIPVSLISKDFLPNIVFENSQKNGGNSSRQLLSSSSLFALYALKELILSLFLVPSILKVIKTVRKHSLVPVILAFDDNFSSLPAFIASLITNTPYTIQAHGLYANYISFFTQNSAVQNLLLKIQRFTITNAELVLNVNSETMGYFNSHYKLPSAKNWLLPTPIDTVLFSPNSIYRNDVRKEFGITSTAYVIGFVGRLSPEKNVQSLLYAFNKALKASLVPVETVVLIVGDGQLKADLIELSQKLSISDQVIFTGFRRDVHRLMNAVDTLVLPSYVEGFPCSILEAMSCGVPIACSDLPCHVGFLEKAKCGFTFHSEQIEELIDCLATLSKNPSLRRQLGLNGRRYVEDNHSGTPVINEYLKAMSTSMKTLHNK